jgi:multidrug transporter EmrE-like cation transporter
MTMKKYLPFIVLHGIIAIYSVSGICSKAAASKDLLSPEWIVLYGLLLLILAFYAVMWQQILKRLPLSVAYANKGVGVIWGIVWGALVFGENISPGCIIGAVLIVAGVVLMSPAGEKVEKEKRSDE